MSRRRRHRLHWRNIEMSTDAGTTPLKITMTTNGRGRWTSMPLNLMLAMFAMTTVSLQIYDLFSLASAKAIISACVFVCSCSLLPDHSRCPNITNIHPSSNDSLGKCTDASSVCEIVSTRQHLCRPPLGLQCLHNLIMLWLSFGARSLFSARTASCDPQARVNTIMWTPKIYNASWAIHHRGLSRIAAKYLARKETKRQKKIEKRSRTKHAPRACERDNSTDSCDKIYVVDVRPRQRLPGIHGDST